MNVKEILLIFCQYGFRKASMEDIARAADLSRQSIYKKFGSKEGVFEWAVETAAAASCAHALEALSDPKLDVRERIAEAFDRWIGGFVPVIHNTPHGTEMLERASEMAASGRSTTEAKFYQAVTRTLLETGCASNMEKADDLTFVLALVGKGLLLRSDTQETFRKDFERVTATLIAK
ncbi:TetR/AcrR family transcriptional regulator [uncultured Cohaesibacter sp.]|uniref:TetR/AcrR family transcriptional regulator n=1 Tax=uncultured Cohaesibacter sp. TaxID=1002546 RepID=UPI0029C84838|nr:TetR/AcrR family transcriptional regulator [uncultured Cohaesibacter sp.]